MNEIAPKLSKNTTTKKSQKLSFDFMRPKNAKPARPHGLPKIHK